MLRMIGYRSAILLVAAIALLSPTRMRGQGTDLGTIRGAVTDNSGARIPRVTVTITDTGTKAQRELTTNDLGEYEAAGQKSGSYTVTFAAQGFNTLQVGPVALRPSEITRIDGRLEVGQTSETVTVVADVVGGPYWPKLIDVLARGGRYTCSGAIAGPIVEFDLRTFYLRDLTFTGATVVPPGTFGDLVGYVARGEIRPLLAASYPLKDLREAQEAFIAKAHVGNIVVTQ